MCALTNTPIKKKVHAWVIYTKLCLSPQEWVTNLSAKVGNDYLV